MLVTIDDSLELKDIDLYIAKPNKKTIGHLTEAYNKSYYPKMGNLSELSFTIPYLIDKNHELIDNPNIKKTKDRFLIKAIYDGKVEWFRIDELNPVSDDNGEFLNVHAFSLGIELGDKIARLINETSKDVKYMMNLCLSDTPWSIGTVDNELTGIFRSFDITETTRLDFLYQIAETYKGIIVWDTVNRKIDLKAQSNVGNNKGLRISYGKYMKSLSKETNSNEMVTRLIPRGRDNLTIRSVSPNGSESIDDFSYFLYPFHRDENRNVISHSYYMDDNLCHAILDYNELIISKDGELSALLSERNNLNKTLLIKQNELVDLNTELIQIQDSIDIELTNGRSATSYQQQESAKKTEINTKKIEITNIESQLISNQASITTLQALLSAENNFTVEQIKELETSYIIQKTWSNDNIIDPNDLLKEAKKAFVELHKPKTVFTLDIVNFTQILEAQKDWGKLNIGDTVNIHHERLGENLTAKIIEFGIDFEAKTVNLTIANTNDILSDEEKFYQRLYEANQTSIAIDMNKYKWNETVQSTSIIGEIIEGKWESAKREIVAGVNESVIINNRGITIQDSNDPLRYIRMTNSVIGLTEDDGNTFKTAISPKGIVAENIYGKLLAGENLIIDASNSNGTSIFTVDGSGVKILGSSLSIEGGLPKDQLDPSFAEGLVEINKDYSNGIRIDSVNGVVVSRSDNKIKTTLNSTSGIKIERNNGTSSSPSWEDIFYADTNGNLIANNLVTRKISIRDNSNNVIIDANTGTIDFSKFPNKIGILDSNNIPNLSASKITSGTIDANYVNVINLNASNISSGSISGNYISGGTIYGTTISGGIITSNSTINVTTDVEVGRNIYLGRSMSGSKEIRFNGANVIYDNGTLMTISAQQLSLNTPYLSLNRVSNIDWGNHAPTARFG